MRPREGSSFSPSSILGDIKFILNFMKIIYVLYDTKIKRRMLYILNEYNIFIFPNWILLIVPINATYDFHVVNKWVSMRPGVGWFAG